MPGLIAGRGITLTPDASANTVAIAVASAIYAAVAAITTAGVATVVKDTKAHLDADLAHGDGTVAVVLQDATAANNDIYVKVGASGAGSWSATGIYAAAAQAYVQAIADDAADSAAAAAASEAAVAAALGDITLTIGRDLNTATTQTIGNLAFDSGAGASAGPAYVYLSQAMPRRGRVHSMTWISAGATADGEIHIYSHVLGAEISLAQVIDVGPLSSGSFTYNFSPPLDVEKGDRIGLRYFLNNVSFRSVPDDGQQIVQHGFGVGAAVLGTHYKPTTSASSGALAFDFESVPDNNEVRLTALASPRLYSSPYHEHVLIDETLNSLPVGWTFAGGTWTADGTGITGPTGSNGTYAVASNVGPSSMARRIFDLDIHSPTTADIAGLCTLPISGTNYGGVQLLVDRVAGKFRFYAWNGAGDNGTLAAEAALPTNSGAMDFRLRVHKDNFVHTLQLVDRATGKEAVIEADHDKFHPYFFALFHGSMGVASRAGAARFDRFRVVAPYAANPFVIVGDSITDGSGVMLPGEETFANLAARGRNDIIVAGRSGDTSANFLLRQSVDLIARAPSWLIYALGTNDHNQATTRTNAAATIAAARAVGAKVAMVTLPSIGAAVNADIRGGFFDCDRVIDLAAAITTNQDSTTFATGMDSGDGVHPTGYAHATAMLQRLYRDLPEIAA